ncbi:hypothetical protein E2C01_051049 [Portunus trituberculatus]|uniref:Uncharacterized protein n=1 Tax=Portunus trituberculatus TaxID=210409 RepID=A0A5B7GII4_PORTR|nr:hypothetical protein [Portunus trituberculatus]
MDDCVKGKRTAPQNRFLLSKIAAYRSRGSRDVQGEAGERVGGDPYIVPSRPPLTTDIQDNTVNSGARETKGKKTNE